MVWRSKLRIATLALSVLTGSCVSLPAPRFDAVIDHPEKIGIGTGAWDGVTPEQALADVNRVGASWHYTWQAQALDGGASGAGFVPMAWGRDDVEAAFDGRSGVLLGFNEPDMQSQAALAVGEALALWPALERTGLRLGSPSNSSGAGVSCDQAVAPWGWLPRFMDRAEAEGRRVDFMAVHYFTDSADVGAMARCLTAINDRYGRPLWVTEWALVDWERPDRFGKAATSAFLREASLMMDELDFVERHAWFAMYEGGDDWYINTELIGPDGALTEVGEAYRSLVDSARVGADAAGTTGSARSRP